jgi:hypothetical protein
MPQKFRQHLRFNGGFVPSQQVNGEANDTVYRGQNVIFKGSAGNIYAEAFRGWQDRTNGTIFLINTGITVTAISGNQTITQTPASGGMAAALRGGHMIQLDGRPYLITAVPTTNTATIQPAFQPVTTPLPASYTIFVMPTLCPMNNRLGVAFGGGNAISLPRGHILTTGIKNILQGYPNPASGTVVVNDIGLGVSGSPALIRAPSFLTEIPLGFAVPVISAITAVGTGTKNMPAGTYSMRISRGRSETTGYGNPSEAAEVTINAGQAIRITFPAFATGQTTWRIFGSLFSVAEGITGPWYELDELTTTQVTTGGPGGANTFDFEWRDFEIAGSQLATFDNNIPPQAEFVVLFGGIPILLSCLGQPPSDTPTAADRSPGPSLQPAKAYNIEGFPAAASLAVGPVQNIVGFVEGEGRLYVMTSDYVHIVTLTGNPDQPLTVRPFVQSSFVRHNSLVYVEGILYGYGRRGPVRISGAEGTGAEDRTFAAAVRDVTADWEAARVFVMYDPYNEAIVYIHSSDDLLGGFWTSKALVYHLPLGIWSTPLIIQESGRDMNVSGVATLNGRAFFVTANDLWMWDAGAADRQWFVTTPFIDQSAEGLDKNIRNLAVTGRGGIGYAGVYGPLSGDPVDIGSLEAIGAGGSRSGSIVLQPTSNEVAVSKVYKLNVRNIRLYALKVGGTDVVARPRDRVDEMVLTGNVHGPER